MDPIKDLYGDYLMRLAQQFPGLDPLLTPYVGDKIHDYAQAYGPGGQFYAEPLNMAAARNAGRIQPAPFAMPIYEQIGFGKVVDGKFVWAAHMTAPYTGLPQV